MTRDTATARVADLAALEHALRDALDELSALKHALRDARADLAALERALRDARAAAGRRPGDGSDQPSLFGDRP